MKSIGLVIDNISSLPREIIKGNDIKTVKINLDFPPLEENPNRNLYDLMEQTDTFPKTAAPSPGSFLKAYREALEDNNEVLVITLSSELSAIYDSACQGRRMLSDPSKVKILDSRQVSVAEGLLVLKAAKLIKQKEDINEIVKELKQTRVRIQTFILTKDIKWTKKTGRVSSFQAKGFNFLKNVGINPIMKIKEGKVSFGGFNFISNDPLEILFRALKKQKDKYGNLEVGLNYTNNINLTNRLKEKVERDLKTEVLFVSSTPVVIGAHTGPGTIIAGSIPKSDFNNNSFDKAGKEE